MSNRILHRRAAPFALILALVGTGCVTERGPAPADAPLAEEPAAPPDPKRLHL
jgi:hypothetical protein